MEVTKKYAIYVDLSRALSQQECSTVFEILDRIVPDSGCVGPQKGTDCEVYFHVNADCESEAKSLASDYMQEILQRANLDATYSIGYICQIKAP